MMSPACVALWLLLNVLGLGRFLTMNDVVSLDPVGMNPKAPARFFQGYRTTGWQTDIQRLTYTFSKHVQMLFSNAQINAKYY